MGCGSSSNPSSAVRPIIVGRKKWGRECLHLRHLSIRQSSQRCTWRYEESDTSAEMAAKTPTAAIFEGLKGRWKLRRSLNSTLAGFPSGIFTGTATFTSRIPTAHSTAAEMLYAESGELKTDTGLTLSANRSACLPSPEWLANRADSVAFRVRLPLQRRRRQDQRLVCERRNQAA